MISTLGNWKVLVTEYSGTAKPEVAQEKGGKVPPAVVGPNTARKERVWAEEDDITLASVAPYGLRPTMKSSDCQEQETLLSCRSDLAEMAAAGI